MHSWNQSVNQSEKWRSSDDWQLGSMGTCPPVLVSWCFGIQIYSHVFYWITDYQKTTTTLEIKTFCKGQVDVSGVINITRSKTNVATRIFDFQSISIAQITVSLLVISFGLLDETEINWANTIRAETHLHMSLRYETVVRLYLNLQCKIQGRLDILAICLFPLCKHSRVVVQSHLRFS